MEKVVNMIIEAYVKVMGAEKWNQMTAKQQHDAIMKIAADLDKAIA